MTVKELVEALSKAPQDVEVEVLNDSNDYQWGIQSVKFVLADPKNDGCRDGIVQLSYVPEEGE